MTVDERALELSQQRQARIQNYVNNYIHLTNNGAYTAPSFWSTILSSVNAPVTPEETLNTAVLNAVATLVDDLISAGYILIPSGGIFYGSPSFYTPVDSSDFSRSLSSQAIAVLHDLFETPDGTVFNTYIGNYAYFWNVNAGKTAVGPKLAGKLPQLDRLLKEVIVNGTGGNLWAAPPSWFPNIFGLHPKPIVPEPSSPGGSGGGGGGSHATNDADPEDAPQLTGPSQTATPSGSQPTPAPVVVVDPVDTTPPSVVVHPNPPQHTNVQPQQQRYVAGGNVPLPTRPDPGPQFTGGDGDGIISMGGRLLGGSTQSVPGFDFIAGTGEATPVFRPRRGYTPPSSGTGVQDGSPSRTVTDDGSGDGSGYASQNNQDPADIWSVGGSGRHGREGDPDTSDSESQNRNRYSGDQSGSNSDNSSSTSSTASDGSTDSQGPQDRDRSGWQFGLISGGGDEDKNPSSPMTGDPNPYDPDGSDEAPTIPGRGFHPHGGDTAVAAAPNLPDPGDVATGGPFAGWTSGDGGDWGGNPHENPDPDDTGGSSNINPAAVAQNNANPDDVRFPLLPSDAGGNQDDFWSGNNPHYMPYQGAAWTPVASVSRVTKASTVSRSIVRAGQVHFK